MLIEKRKLGPAKTKKTAPVWPFVASGAKNFGNTSVPIYY